MGCIWAMWCGYFMYKHGSNDTTARLWVSAWMLPVACVGTYLHAGKFFGYAGLVAAFTTPIIAVG